MDIMEERCTTAVLMVALLTLIIHILIILLVFKWKKRRRSKPQTGRQPVRYSIDTTDSSSLLEGGELYYIAQKILIVFEQKQPYLDPDLKISDAALLVGTNRNYLSRAINTYFKKNFNQFCNYYRIRSACKTYIKNPGITKDEWIRQSGFLSFSSFSSSFSNFTGFSPNRWQKEIYRRLENKEKISVDEYIRDFRKIMNF